MGDLKEGYFLLTCFKGDTIAMMRAGRHRLEAVKATIVARGKYGLLVKGFNSFPTKRHLPRGHRDASKAFFRKPYILSLVGPGTGRKVQEDRYMKVRVWPVAYRTGWAARGERTRYREPVAGIAGIPYDFCVRSQLLSVTESVSPSPTEKFQINIIMSKTNNDYG